MWKAVRHMSLSEVADAQKVNERALSQLRSKREEGGRNPGATMAAIERRRVLAVELCDRRRELLNADRRSPLQREAEAFYGESIY